MLLRKVLRNDQLIVSFLALVVGVGTGLAVIGFREAIAFIQTAVYGSGTERFYQYAETLPWWMLLLVPAGGGLLIGLLLRFVMPGGQPVGVADTIEACALRNGSMEIGKGLAGGVINAISIGVGASVGREGPAVHLGASLGGWLAHRLHLTRAMSRTLLGCGAAAAVSASFNAPIAGALFASEVVVGHYALSAFAPIVIASVAGTAMSRGYFGDLPAFDISQHTISSFLEFPAFIGLGIVCGLVAFVMMQMVMTVNDTANKLSIPHVLRPATAGLMVGAIAIYLPQVMGVGYGATESALIGEFSLVLLVSIAAAKIIATALSLGLGFGGGIFSPALVVGAMVGGAYGTIATHTFPELSSGAGAYTIVGMGAVAAAVLGAPISTALIIFEMTGDYALTLALMVSVVLSTLMTQQMGRRSFFSWQLERQGLDLRDGFEMALLRLIKVNQVMSMNTETALPGASLPELRSKLQNAPDGVLFMVREDGGLYGTVTFPDLSESAFDPELDNLITASDVARLHPPSLTLSDDLETAMKLIQESGERHIAVVRDAESQYFVGCLHERDVTKAYNQALIENRSEERGH